MNGLCILLVHCPVLSGDLVEENCTDLITTDISKKVKVVGSPSDMVDSTNTFLQQKDQ